MHQTRPRRGRLWKRDRRPKWICPTALVRCVTLGTSSIGEEDLLVACDVTLVLPDQGRPDRGPRALRTWRRVGVCRPLIVLPRRSCLGVWIAAGGPSLPLPGISTATESSGATRRFQSRDRNGPGEVEPPLMNGRPMRPSPGLRSETRGTRHHDRSRQRPAVPSDDASGQVLKCQPRSTRGRRSPGRAPRSRCSSGMTGQGSARAGAGDRRRRAGRVRCRYQRRARRRFRC